MGGSAAVASGGRLGGGENGQRWVQASSVFSVVAFASLLVLLFRGGTRFWPGCGGYLSAWARVGRMDGRTGCKQAKGGWARRAGHSRGIIAGQDRTKRGRARGRGRGRGRDCTKKKRPWSQKPYTILPLPLPLPFIPYIHTQYPFSFLFFVSFSNLILPLPRY